MAIESLVDDFLRSVARRYTPDTLKSYTTWTTSWQISLGERANRPETWSVRDVEGWQESLAERLSPSSQATAAACLRGLLKWAVRHDRPVKQTLWMTVDRPKIPRLLPRPLPADHLTRLLLYLKPRRTHAPLTYWRDRALVYYLLTTGARVSEVLQVDVDEIGNAPAMVRQKGGGMKALFAAPSAQEAIWDYLRHRDDNHPALWITTTDNQPVRAMSSEAVRRMCHRLAEQVGIRPFTTHQLRHTCATELLDAGVAPEVVAAHLGHHGLGSLAGYGEIRLGRRAEAVAAMEARVAGVALRPPGVAGVVLKAGRRRTPLV